MVIQILAAAVASLCFGVVFQIRGKKLAFAAGSGAVAYSIYLCPWAQSTVIAIFCASCAITLYAEIVARVQKSPATVFLVAGLIPIVPGGGIYRCMYQALAGDLSQAAYTGYTTFLEAGAIAIGVVTVASLMKLPAGVRTLHNQRRRNSHKK